MSNRFFDFAASLARFIPRTKARAEDVNARLDEVSYGFELAQQELDAHTAAIALRAPLAAPALTGAATLDGVPLATQAYAQSLAFQTVLPAIANNAGNDVQTDGTSAFWSAKPRRLRALGTLNTLGF